MSKKKSAGRTVLISRPGRERKAGSPLLRRSIGFTSFFFLLFVPPNRSSWEEVSGHRKRSFGAPTEREREREREREQSVTPVFCEFSCSFCWFEFVGDVELWLCGIIANLSHSMHPAGLH